jgi:hypothetical protein
MDCTTASGKKETEIPMWKSRFSWDTYRLVDGHCLFISKEAISVLPHFHGQAYHKNGTLFGIVLHGNIPAVRFYNFFGNRKP